MTTWRGASRFAALGLLSTQRRPPPLLRIARAYEGATAEAAWRTVEPPGLATLRAGGAPTPAERVAALGAGDR